MFCCYKNKCLAALLHDTLSWASSVQLTSYCCDLSASELLSDFHTKFCKHFWFSHKSCMSGLLSKLTPALTHLTCIWEMPCSHCILRFFMNSFNSSRQVPGLYLAVRHDHLFPFVTQYHPIILYSIQYTLYSMSYWQHCCRS